MVDVCILPKRKKQKLKCATFVCDVYTYVVTIYQRQFSVDSVLPDMRRINNNR